MQWKKDRNGGFSTADPALLYAPLIQTAEFGIEQINIANQENDPASLLNLVRRMIQIRKAHPAFGWGDFSWAAQLAPKNDTIAAYWRTTGAEHMLILQNLSEQAQEIHLDLPQTSTTLRDLLIGKLINLDEPHRLDLIIQPYDYRWLSC